MSIFGRSYGFNISGELYLNGEKTELKSAEQAIRHGLAYVTEDRKTNGLILGESIRFNTTLARLDKVCGNGVIDTTAEQKVAEDMTEAMGTKTPSIEQKVGNLSGGNQQKALLGKWMFTEPEVLILDEPTRGIDVGAKYDIYCLINQMERGKIRDHDLLGDAGAHWYVRPDLHHERGRAQRGAECRGSNPGENHELYHQCGRLRRKECCVNVNEQRKSGRRAF